MFKLRNKKLAVKGSNTVWEKGRIEIGKYVNNNFNSEMLNKIIKKIQGAYITYI